MNKFLTFLSEYNQYDPILIECIFDSYHTIFESTETVTIDVLKAYFQLLTLTKLPTLNNDSIFNTKIKMLDNDITIYFTYKNPNDIISPNVKVYAFSGLDNDIQILCNELVNAILSKNIMRFKQLLKENSIQHAIIHELSHIYEYINRSKESVETQMINTTDINSSYNTDDKVHTNHKIELLPHKISLLSTALLDTRKQNMKDPNKIMKYIQNSMPYKEVFDLLDNRNKKKVLQTISNIIHKIISKTAPELNDIINMISKEIRK